MMRTRQAFTLIEVVIALGIMAMIGALSWTAIAGSVEMRDILEQQDASDRSARIALSRLTRELQLSYITKNDKSPNTYQTVFIGQSDSDASTLWFATTGHHRTIANSREGDQAEVTVWAESDPNGDHLVLLHRESSFIDGEPDVGGRVLPIATDVTRFELSFFDGELAEWDDEWDTTGSETPNRLPRAIQLVLGLASPDPDDQDETIERTYVRTIIVERATPTTRDSMAGDGGGAGPIDPGLGGGRSSSSGGRGASGGGSGSRGGSRGGGSRSGGSRGGGGR